MFIDCVLVLSDVKLLTVSRAGGRCLLAGPEGDVCGQVPPTGGDDGQPKPQPGVQSGATGPPLRRGTHNDLPGSKGPVMSSQAFVGLLAAWLFFFKYKMFRNS